MAASVIKAENIDRSFIVDNGLAVTSGTPIETGGLNRDASLVVFLTTSPGTGETVTITAEGGTASGTNKVTNSTFVISGSEAADGSVLVYPIGGNYPFNNDWTELTAVDSGGTPAYTMYLMP